MALLKRVVFSGILVILLFLGHFVNSTTAHIPLDRRNTARVEIAIKKSQEHRREEVHTSEVQYTVALI